LFKCDCGNIKELQAKLVFTEHNKSCGNCNLKSKEYFLSKKFGKLQLEDKNLPEFVREGVRQQFLFRCDCGKESYLDAKDVFRGHTESCGNCNTNPKEWWLKQKFGRLVLIDKDLPIEIAFNSNNSLNFKCNCGTEKQFVVCNVTSGKSTSCGCGQLFPGSVSKTSKSMFEELKETIPNLQFSVRTLIANREIDFYHPDSQVAIEYNGLSWHSEKILKDRDLKRDFEKYLQLKKLGIRYIGIFSDEWKNHKDVFTDIILNTCGITKGSKRVYNFEIVETDKFEFQPYHDQFHYLTGRQVHCTLYLLAKYKDEVMGGWAFKKINNDTLDWSRAFWNHNYKAWNPHEKALKYAIKKFPEIFKVITFSDNRLFNGSMYQNLGFVKTKEITPDYEYTNGFVRKHKFNFRVKAGISEVGEAAKQGFYRIFDCGKTKWEYKVNP